VGIAGEWRVARGAAFFGCTKDRRRQNFASVDRSEEGRYADLNVRKAG